MAMQRSNLKRETAQARGWYASGIGDFGSSPGLLLGLAGTGLSLMRLQEPGLVTNAVVPSLMP